MAARARPPVVSFLSDFGTADDFVGVCHGVILTVCPEAQVIHLTHGIRPHAVGQGARVLAGALRFLPVGVHLAVVDPGVGSERRAIALRSGDGRLFVGPDNGLLIPAADAAGGVEEAVEITNPEVMLSPVSRTFHGRDVFSPAAGHLAAGAALSDLGPVTAPAGLVHRPGPEYALAGETLRAVVQHIDRFGNILLAVTRAELGGAFRPGATAELVTADDRYYVRCAETFADVDPGEFVLYEAASGVLAVAVNRGSAAQLTATEVGGVLSIEFGTEVGPAGA
jgi:S-adenosyl-L-methionine hydrolase (adenosine-forming)